MTFAVFGIEGIDVGVQVAAGPERMDQLDDARLFGDIFALRGPES